MSLTKPEVFFDRLRTGLLGPKLIADEVNGVNAILAACEGWPLSWTAYALATAYLETGHTMQPVMEANWLKKAAAERYFHRMYDRAGQRPEVAKRLGNTTAGDGVKFAGRGYVQITGRSNYAKAMAKTGFDLIADPDLALRADVAAPIMRHGMTEGWFTTKKLKDYLPVPTAPGTLAAFKQCRRIINGQDRAGEIAQFARIFQGELQAGGWR